MAKIIAAVNRQRILDASQELFFRHGIKSITMDDICHHLGMSKKTVYEVFPDKDTIVLRLTEAELAIQVEEMEQIRKQSRNAIDELFSIMDFSTKHISKMNPSVMYDLQKYYVSAWKKFRNFKENNLLKLIESNLHRGIREGLYREDMPVHILARLRMEEVEMGFNPNMFPLYKFSLTVIQNSLLEHFMYGITTMKGHKLINQYKKMREN